MTIHTLPLGDYQANCYILSEQNRCILIDPGAQAPVILDFLNAHGLQPEAVLLTHGHFDHVGAVAELLGEIDCPVYLHSGDYDYPPQARQWFPLAGSKLEDLRFCSQADVLELAGMKVAVLETPGHTRGSVCFGIGTDLFTGDTLFSGSIGRTDLPGGDMHTMLATLQRLKALEQNYTVYPGHGPKTTLDREKKVNPYMR